MGIWGDRYGGYRVKDLDAIHCYMGYVMPKRTDAEVYLNQQIDVTELLKYIKEKNAVEFIGVTAGECEANLRNTVKVGVFIGEEKYFIREDANPYLFNACSIKTAGY